MGWFKWEGYKGALESLRELRAYKEIMGITGSPTPLGPQPFSTSSKYGNRKGTPAGLCGFVLTESPFKRVNIGNTLAKRENLTHKGP